LNLYLKRRVVKMDLEFINLSKVKGYSVIYIYYYAFAYFAGRL